MISLLGVGFIGKRIYELYPNDIIAESRESNVPKFDDIIYCIGSNTNYNIFNNTLSDVESNLVKLIKVLDNCKNRKNVNFLYLSSWFVYAKNENLPSKEKTLSRPLGLYSATKLCAELILETYAKVFGFNYKIVRLSNVIGPGDKNISAKKNALTFLINKIKNNEDVNLYHGGDVIRDFIYIDDACKAIKLVFDKGENNSIYNIGSGTKIKMIDILNYVKQVTNSKSKFNSILPPRFHEIVQVRNSYLDITKLKNLGFVREYDIFDAVKTLL